MGVAGGDEYKSVFGENARGIQTCIQASYEASLEEVKMKIAAAEASIRTIKSMDSNKIDTALLQDLQADIKDNEVIVSQIQEKLNVHEDKVLKTEAYCEDFGWKVPESSVYTRETIQQDAMNALAQAVTEKLAAKATAEKDMSSRAKI